MKHYILSVLVMFALSGCVGPCAPMWERWNGEAELARAESSKKIQIEDAKGKLESAKLLADAEVARARGVAEANKIIGTSLKDNEAYLRWLYIEGLKDSKGETVIYVPTEAGLPILEAGRRK